MARLLGLAAMAGVLALSAAEMIIPTNWTAQEAAMSSDSTLMMQISVNERMVPLAPVLVLTTGGKMDIPVSTAPQTSFTTVSNQHRYHSQPVSLAPSS